MSGYNSLYFFSYKISCSSFATAYSFVSISSSSYKVWIDAIKLIAEVNKNIALGCPASMTKDEKIALVPKAIENHVNFKD